MSGGTTGTGFTVVDVETSGLSAGADRVLSVAAIELDRDGEVAREFHTLLDPGCDPGPVHIHGLTTRKLRGSPRFEQIHEQLSGFLAGRVMVAHNARFDYDFLAGEFRRAGTVLPVSQRLCTLTLARRVALPTPDYRLGTLAAYYGVRQRQAHDALDDTRVLAGVLRRLISDALRLGVAPPLLQCPPKDANRHLWRGKAKTPCRYTYAGTFEESRGLVQGMKVAVSGDTRTDRNELVDRAEAVGLDVTGAVSRRTSLLVANDPCSTSAKVVNARDFGTPIVSEARFLEMLNNVAPGRPKGTPPQPDPLSTKASPQRARSTVGPLSGRRILVLGGVHRQATEIRKRIVELGGSAAVNMSASVTDVLALPGAENDPRSKKAAELGLPVHGLEILGEEAGAAGQSTTVSAESTMDARVLAQGQVINLPIVEHGCEWTLRASWRQSVPAEVDVVAFLLDNTERVTTDEDFIFYNQPETHGARLTVDGPSEQSITIDLDSVPEYCQRIVVAAAIDGDAFTFGDLGAIEIESEPGTEAGPFARSALDAATEERTLVLAEIYLRGTSWRLRAVGQGYTSDLAALARGYGVDIAQ
ncbi:hypothetical protein JMUB6875_75160 [Nocardia sp. JMUB6875]|uniref:exonuclease domain-containing protein n=1 Tax=Nocardia sp. JMUB6875 TaxID=3158170 RepID=UPI0032E6797B